MESVRFPTVFDKVDVNLHETVQFLSNQGVKVTICNEQPNKWKEKVIFPDKGKEKVMFSESNNGEETARWLEKEKQKAIYSEIQKLKREIKEKRRQIKVLEKYMTECGEASVANASSVDMQQTSANDHILDEQLQDKLNDEKEKSSSFDEGKEKDISSEDMNTGNANSVSKRSVAQRIRRERERSEGTIHAPRRPSKFFPSLTPSRRVIAQRRRFEMAREAAKRAKLHTEIEKEAPNNEVV